MKKKKKISSRVEFKNGKPVVIFKFIDFSNGGEGMNYDEEARLDAEAEAERFESQLQAMKLITEELLDADKELIKTRIRQQKAQRNRNYKFERIKNIPFFVNNFLFETFLKLRGKNE
jgi:hypothetical protein